MFVYIYMCMFVCVRVCVSPAAPWAYLQYKYVGVSQN